VYFYSDCPKTISNTLFMSVTKPSYSL